MHDSSPLIGREVAYFKDNIGEIATAHDLVNDRTVLKVALGAFGLEADLPNKAFVEKVLSEGSLDDEAFAHRLSDKRYLEMAKAFGFDMGVPNSAISNFGDRIATAYMGRQFEVAVGDADDDMRLALTVKREMPTISGSEISENSKWFTIMGNPPLRQVFDTVFNLPSSFAALDLDRQLEVYQEKAERQFGSSDPSIFVSEETQEELIKQYMIRSQLQAMNTNVQSGQAALTLLQSARLPSPF
ncbi:DUF1217 domain-containing protein [Falsihalocynthiibacter sp. SS001]|uniref:DUF1217 domain-containing protein n=1 Tax=Falsihalocynthiibacter sp. SS001 TaxID=3349698 RepID=UPI0036D3DBF6